MSTALDRVQRPEHNARSALESPEAGDEAASTRKTTI